MEVGGFEKRDGQTRRERSVPSDDYGKNHVLYDYEDGSDSDDRLFPPDGADIDYPIGGQKTEVGQFCEECDEPMTDECDSCGHIHCKDCYSGSICEQCGNLLNNEIHDYDDKNHLYQDIW